MRNLTTNDATQLAILSHLQNTEEMIADAITAETGRQAHAEITAMSDLGLAGNSTRMRGGFFTGMHAQWQSSVPFVPIDATVNSCGVYIFTLKKAPDRNTFTRLISEAKGKITSLGYSWNFERGNHFIAVGHLENGQPCAVMHASADEYKKSKSDLALYPTESSWYYNDIRVYHSLKYVNRYLRYIVGKPAERFIEIALSLEKINKQRMSDVARLIFNELFDSECVFASHYGMPTDTSVAIGCSWRRENFALLTAPGKDIYIAAPVETSGNSSKSSQPALYPHGFGIEIEQPALSYSRDGLNINGTSIITDESVTQLETKRIRMRYALQSEVEAFAEQILEKRGCKITHRIKQTMGLNSDGLT